MKIRLVILSLLLALPVTVFAVNESDTLSKYTTIYSVDTPTLTAPTEVRIELPVKYRNNKFSGDIAKIVDTNTDNIVPILYRQFEGTSFTGQTNTGANANALFDNNHNTSLRFEGPMTEIIFNSLEQTTISQFNLVSGIAGFPENIIIEAELYADNKAQLNKTKILHTSTINVAGFPAQAYTLRIFHTQPFELAEIQIGKLNSIEKEYIHWIAKPNTSYNLYLGLGGNTKTSYQNRNYDSRSKQAPILNIISNQPNPDFVDPDDDQDGIPNSIDNCLLGKNPDQEDANNNGIGDACEDLDQDQVIGYLDNCPEDHNPDQIDTDEDGIGDACDDFENRITERLPILPWLAIIGTALLMGYIIFTNFKSKPTK